MKRGDRVDDFVLPDQTGVDRRFGDLLADGPVVLFFYPAAMTPADFAMAITERAEIDLNTYMSQVPPGVYVLSGPSVSVDAFQKLLSFKVQA